jgi:putative DNA primase/helicase
LTLRYHPSLPYRHEDGRFSHHPAMVARVDDPHGELATLHRTYLVYDGKKAEVPTPKKLMPPAVAGATNGGAIRLYAPTETLAVAEGIETALAVRLATGLPVWSTLSAGGMARLIVPNDVRLVVICADHDPAGLDAAKALARRLLAEGRRVKIITPDTPGADWADMAAEEVGHG